MSPLPVFRSKVEHEPVPVASPTSALNLIEKPVKKCEPSQACLDGQIKLALPDGVVVAVGVAQLEIPEVTGRGSRDGQPLRECKGQGDAP